MLEILKSIRSTQQWWYLAWFDIRQRYRRSVLGPLWITITTGIMVLALGVLWSTLFKTEIREFMPYFAAGLIIWGFLSTQLNEACVGYVQFEGYIKQIYLPFPLYVLRFWARNLIFLAHNMLVFLGVWAFFGFYWMPNFLQLILGFTILSSILFFASIPIATVCARFRDITPIVQSMIQIAYFFTPIMWQIKVLPERYHYLAAYNPLYHILEIVRAPLLGQSPALESWLCSLAILVFSMLVAVFFNNRYSKRIAYWL
ncbi:ABC transporter permease [Hydromonas duriensis]|uniref:Lipopolysaccharide transport system permease protein n=1 Tax=Hydromonas duriensis TaxID=1527608 RepID=A0A4R6Y874_9BURK|nr:ABC transporter permease [Hydromonas duriensis]TDR31563.1 lipopolysaccharide transport system permease protein [Hydromonas duriensis]